MKFNFFSKDKMNQNNEKDYDFENGFFTEKDINVIMRSNKDPYKFYLIAKMYQNGTNGLIQNKSTAIEFFKQASNQGVKEASYELALCYPNKSKERFALLLKAAKGEDGVPDAMNRIGVYYARGWGEVKEDEKLAVEWYQKAAYKGSKWAKYNLAGKYRDGVDGVLEENKNVAFKLYMEAAEGEDGIPDAMNIVGRYYKNGWGGVEKDINEAFNWYKKSADKGFASAQWNLALLYDDEETSYFDKKMALKYYELAAEQNDVSAQYKTGVYYYNGYGMDEPDFDKALKWFKKVADQDDHNAQYYIGLFYEFGKGSTEKDLSKALDCFILSAKQKNKDAIKKVLEFEEYDDVNVLAKLAKLYETGEIVERNSAKTFELNQRIADSKDSSPQTAFYFGEYYCKNADVKDEAKGIQYYQIAADKGYKPAIYELAIHKENPSKEQFDLLLQSAQGEDGIPDAMNRVGKYYVSGWGVVQRNLSLAFEWYKKAAHKGYKRSQYNLAILYGTGIDGVIEKDENKAFKLYLESASGEDGIPEAMNMVGRFYENGWGNVEKDINEAFNWYKKSADKGYAPAQWNLALLFDSKKSPYFDRKMASKYLELAAEQGHIDASFLTGIYYYNGYGMDKPDIEKASFWFTKASEQGNIGAKQWLALMYEKGKGVEKSNAKVYSLFKEIICKDSKRIQIHRCIKLLAKGLDTEEFTNQAIEREVFTAETVSDSSLLEQGFELTESGRFSIKLVLNGLYKLDQVDNERVANIIISNGTAEEMYLFCLYLSGENNSIEDSKEIREKLLKKRISNFDDITLKVLNASVKKQSGKAVVALIEYYNSIGDYEKVNELSELIKSDEKYMRDMSSEDMAIFESIYDKTSFFASDVYKNISKVILPLAEELHNTMVHNKFHGRVIS
ncbi:MAG: sel1 repeat family protein, partial [Eubacterium sp.]|nr:sel1 repeat family protein [Eubacterium sp.]